MSNSDGGSADYYNLPANATELNDLIEHKNMSFALGNIFKAAYRFGEKDAATKLYDVNKIIYFAERLKGSLKMPDNPLRDYATERIIRQCREQAHLFSAWLNPRMSREAAILNQCADDLEALAKKPDSEFDRLMR